MGDIKLDMFLYCLRACVKTSGELIHAGIKLTGVPDLVYSVRCRVRLVHNGQDGKVDRVEDVVLHGIVGPHPKSPLSDVTQQARGHGTCEEVETRVILLAVGVRHAETVSEKKAQLESKEEKELADFKIFFAERKEKRK